MNTKEIDLRDLIFEILLHWRSFILCILIGAVSFGVFSYIHLQKQSTDVTLSGLENNMTQTEKSAVEQALLNRYSCEKWRTYMENSALMNLDASQVYQADLVYAVDTTEDLINPTAVYLDLLAANDIYKFVANKTDGMTMTDAQELIQVLNPGSFTLKQEICSFRITAVSGSKKKCKAVSNAIQSYVDKLHALVINTYGDHNITLLQNSLSAMDSTSLLQEQIDMRNRITHLDSETADIIKNFSETQIRYYQLRTSDGNVSPDNLRSEETTAFGTMHILTRSTVWGMISAVIIYIFIMFFLSITNNKLRYTDNYTVLYQIPVLGHIPSKRRFKTIFDRIDCWLYRKRDKRLYMTPIPEAVRSVSASLQVIVQRKELDHIYGLSCGLLSKNTSKIENEIQDLLNTEGIRFQVIDDILYNADSIRLLCEIQEAVLIEKARSVQYDEFQRSLNFLQQQKIHILGMIIIE